MLCILPWNEEDTILIRAYILVSRTSALHGKEGGGGVHCNPPAFPCMVLHHCTDIMCMSSVNSPTEWPTMRWWVLRSKTRSRCEEKNDAATVQLLVYNLLLNIWSLGQSMPDPFQSISGYTLSRVRNAIDNRWDFFRVHWHSSCLCFIIEEMLFMLKTKTS